MLKPFALRASLDDRHPLVAAWRFVGVDALEQELERAPETFTPWFKMEWVHLRANHLDGMLASTGTDG